MCPVSAWLQQEQARTNAAVCCSLAASCYVLSLPGEHFVVSMQPMQLSGHCLVQLQQQPAQRDSIHTPPRHHVEARSLSQHFGARNQIGVIVDDMHDATLPCNPSTKPYT